METEPKSFGRYRLLERLGGGGMAEVWRAEVSYSADVSKVVALKMIREDLVRVPQFLSLFIDEARITSRLSHANVAQVFDFGEEGGRPFLAMELVEGPDLETILRRARELGQHLPLSFCAYVVAEAARGLAAAHGLKDAEGHSFGIVHRDVSPQNVLLSYAGEVKITDFGIARARDKITQTETGTVMGKFRYMSPEQVQGKAVDARSDVFSCGILLYELITGLQLFDGRTSAEVVDQIRYKAVPDLLALRRDVDPALETVLGDTLARDPSARCPDAATLARDLERYLHVAHPLFTRDEVAHLVGALVPRQSPGRVAQMAFAGTELATGAPGEDEPVATAVPEAPEEAASPSGRKATLLGTGEPAPKVTAPARRTAGGPLVVVAPDALEPGCNRQGDEEEGVPEAPMTVSGALGPGGSFSPLPRPAANSPGAVASAALDPAGAAPASAPPVSGVSAGLAPKAPDLSEGAAGTHGSPTAAGSPGADGGNPMAPGGREAHPEVTAPTRLAAPGGPHPGDPEPMSGLDSTRTQARPGAREPATLASRPRRRGVGILLTLAALVLLAGSLTLIFWRLRGPGTQQGGEQEAAAGGGGQADAQVASPPRGDGGGARPEGDSGAASSQSDQVAELDRKLGQLHILRGPRHERVLRALASGAAYRLMHATVDTSGRRQLGPPPPEALTLPSTDPVAESVSSALEVLAERILLSGELPPEARSLLRPVPESLPARVELLEQFPGTALYAIDQPGSALALELHIRATGWQQGWRRPLAGQGGRRLLWPHLAVARDAVARLGELSPKSALYQDLNRYLEANPIKTKAQQGALMARLESVSRVTIKKSPNISIELAMELWNADPGRPLAVQPLEWRLFGLGPSPLTPNFWDPELVEPLAPGKSIALKVTFSCRADQWSPALVLSLPLAGGGALWFQAGSELLR